MNILTPEEPVRTPSVSEQFEGRSASEPYPRRRVRLLLAWAWTLGILLACWMPSNRLPIDEEGSSFFSFPHRDKLAHFTLFAGFGLLWMRGLRRPSASWVVVAGIAMAVATEAGQSIEALGRDPDVFDALADSAGALAGVAAWCWARRARTPFRS